jgi:pimeloyl-ACP methyl ester carboxylesterase
MLYHESVGSGPPVLLLPGMLGTIESDWKPYMQPIADMGYTAIAVDLPGHGKSEMTKSLTMRVLVEEIDSFLKNTHADPAVFLGYDLGGYAALSYAIKNRNRVVGLWLHSTKFYWSGAEAEDIAAGLSLEYLQENKQEWLEELQAAHGDNLEVILPWLNKLVINLPDTGLTEMELEDINFPVMVSVGDRDELVPVSEAVDLYKHMPQCELSVFPDTLHPISSLRNHVFLPVFRDFMNRLA